MGPLQPESNPNISVMEPEHQSKTSSELRTQAAATNPFEAKSSSSSSSSFSSSSSKGFVELDTDEISDTRTPHKPNKDSRLVSNSGDKDEEIPVSSMPRPEQNSGELSTTQSPPTQVMERADEFGDGDPNRIPARVFDRSKSSAPVEWSACSNESLFSIHMGNMSFTRDHVNWIGKSGELGYVGEYSPSMPPIDFSSNQPPSSQAAELNIKKSGNLNQGLGATEAAAAETMREVIRENAASEELVHSPERLSPQKVQPRATRPSHNSDDSIKSFAFPILTGDVDNTESMSVGKNKRKKQAASQPQTPKTTPQQQPESEPQTPNPQATKPQAPKEGQNGGQIKWLACFSCCPFCS